ncbi:unnamed protein product [Penicillium bialowiezense]
MHILVLGANGAIGRIFCDIALQEGHRLTLFVRTASKVPEDIRLHASTNILEGTLEVDSDLDRAAECGADIFIAFAGPSYGSKGTPLADGYKLMIPKLASHNISRVLILSTPSFRDQIDIETWKWRSGSWFMKMFFPDGYREMVSVGDTVSSSEGIQWGIFRVGGLTNGEEAPVEATWMPPSQEGPGETIAVPEAPHPELSMEDAHGGQSSPSDSLIRTRELQLMHHWTLKTCHSFSAILSGVFQTYVVKQALQYPFLMDSLLALTSLHIASELAVNDSERSELLSGALRYQSRAMPAFRLELGKVTSTNCDALFACSVILMACNFVFPSLEASDEPETNLRVLFHLLKGIHSIMDQSRASLEDGPFKIIIQHCWEADPALLSGKRVLPSELRSMCEASASQSIYQTAIDTLEECAMAEGMVIPWIVLAGEEFVEQIENGEPLALLIYACWAALMAGQEMWWAKIAGQRIVRNLGQLKRDEEWNSVLRWAKEISQADTYN